MPSRIHVISGDHSPPRLVGRTAELEALGRLLEAASEAGAGLAVLEGPAGIGKTRLLNEVVTMAGALGFQCLTATCEEGLRTPFGPLTAALGPIVAPTTIEPIPEYVMVEEISNRLEERAAGGPFLFCLDDLQWADSSTLTTLRRAARRLAPMPVAIVVAVRSEHSPVVAGTLEDLARAGAERIRVDRLSGEEAALLARAVAGDAASPVTGELLDGASGNPLYIVELTRSLPADRGEARVGASMAGLPATFRALVVRRLGSLSEPARRTVRDAAILGLSFDVGELAAAVGRSAFDLAPALDEAIQAGIIRPDGDRLVFAHALVRRAIYEDVPASLRRQLHRETAAALIAGGTAPERVAEHMILGADRGDRAAVGWLREAAAHVARHAPRSAAELLERAREIVAPTDADRDELLADLAMAWARIGRVHDAEALASDVLRRSPRPAVAGRLRAGIVYALTWQGRPGAAAEQARAPEPKLLAADRILVEAQGCVAHILTGDALGARVGILASLVAARGASHPLALCHALCAATRERMLSGHLADSLAAGREAVNLAEVDLSLAPAQPWFFLGLALTIADRTDEAEAVVRRGREVSEELGLVWALPLYMSYLANVYWLTGSWEDALAEDEAAQTISEEFGLHLSVILASASRRARIELHRGRIDQADRALAEAEGWLAHAGRQGGDALVISARALTLEAQGRLPEAADLLARVWQSNLDAGVVSEVRLLGPDLVRLWLVTGRHANAAALVPQVAAMASQLGVPSAEGAALRCEGLVAGSPDLLVRAVDAYRRSPRRVELAQTCAEAAALLATDGRRELATEFLREAAGFFGGLGASREMAGLRATARRFGVAGLRRQRRPATGWAALTDSERRVAELVAQGATNREVAAGLWISTHTVDSHLRHAFAKLGVSSRVQLATIAAMQGRSP
jgi:DNA-binding CsgD family transcriptional regulator/tetratricopeptide (TPR) repeat protein